MEWITAIFGIIKAIPILDRWFEASSAVYWSWKYKKNQDDFYKAVDKAKKKKSTKDLQREIGEKLMLLLVFVPLMMGAGQCGGKEIKTLCILDIEKQMCWIDEETKVGISFEMIVEKEINHDIATFCLDEKDLETIYDKLNRCANQPKALSPHSRLEQSPLGNAQRTSLGL